MSTNLLHAQYTYTTPVKQYTNNTCQNYKVRKGWGFGFSLSFLREKKASIYGPITLILYQDTPSGLPCAPRMLKNSSDVAELEELHFVRGRIHTPCLHCCISAVSPSVSERHTDYLYIYGYL